MALSCPSRMISLSSARRRGPLVRGLLGQGLRGSESPGREMTATPRERDCAAHRLRGSTGTLQVVHSQRRVRWEGVPSAEHMHGRRCSTLALRPRVLVAAFG
jgi:hypothetical protein